MAAEILKKEHKYSGKRKVILIISIMVAALLISFFLIGTFYGKVNEIKAIYYYEENMPPFTIYRVGSELYVPVTIDESTHKIIDNIPYYYGTLSQKAYDMVFDEMPASNKDSDPIKVSHDFLYGQKWPPSQVYAHSVRIGNRTLGDEFRMISQNDTDTLLCRIDKCYSRNMFDNWYEYANELDIIFDVQLRKDHGKNYTVADTDFKRSIYYIPTNDFTKGRFWHQFKKHLAFFASDVKGLFE